MTPSHSLDGLQTEGRNPKTSSIDTAATEELCRIINREDSTIPSVVEACIPTIAAAIDALTPRVRSGGRIFYIGAGTSGRLGVLDASEIPPTFSSSPEQWVALIAGGDGALRNAKEGAEDSPDAAVADLSARNLSDRDCLIGIAASGRTPYVVGGLKYAKRIGCVTVGVACAAPSTMSDSGNIDFMIAAVTGPEAVTGSTRMKAGTATKLVLNMISTGVMIRLGKTYGNVMIDLKPTNVKLRMRARGMLREICGSQCPKDDEEIDSVLEQCGNSVKLAAAKICLQCSAEEAATRLLEVGGVLAGLWETSELPSLNGTPDRKRRRPEHVLCIDGGGSKCKAVIKDRDGISGVGEAGPCNPSDVGVEAAVACINLAIHRATASCFPAATPAAKQIAFAQVWIGVAGVDREPVKERMRREMLQLLRGRDDVDLTITNDIEMMATAAGFRLGVEDVIVLVAGTGSVAMRYRKENGRFRRISRSGGWGPLLGDDGSGFDMGRQGLRACLEVMESSDGEEDALVSKMMAHLQAQSGGQVTRDVLSSILSVQSGDSDGVAKTRRRIASCAPVVLASAEWDGRARDIVKAALHSLVTLLSRLCRTAGSEEAGVHLVLAGGLMQSKAFRKELQGLAQEMVGKRISSIEHVEDPAAMGAECLAQQIWSEDASA